MKSRLSTIAIVLWGATALGAAGWAFFKPKAEPVEGFVAPNDMREVLYVTPKERAVIAKVMRKNLRTISDILKAADSGNMEELGKLAKEGGQSPGPGRKLPKLRKNLPPEWREMGTPAVFSFHRPPTSYMVRAPGNRFGWNPPKTATASPVPALTSLLRY